jgi:eukaryotic-like serine/threonine-protein kinase
MPEEPAQVAVQAPAPDQAGDAWGLVERLVERFENAWQRGRRPDVELYLREVPEADRPALLVELAHVDLEYRLKAGGAALAEDYLGRYPELRDDREAALGLIAAEHDLRRRRGDACTAEEYLARFPDLREPLAARLEGRPAPEQPSAPAAHQAPTIPTFRGHAAAGGATVVLEVFAGPHAPARFEFSRHQTFLVGRASAAHLRLPADRAFSRHHFLLECQPPRCWLRDLGSRNGTLVNGTRVKEALLRDGDVISAGRTCIRFTVRRGPAPAAPAGAPCAGCGALLPAAELPFPEDRPADALYLCDACRQAGRDSPVAVPGYEVVRQIGQGGMGVVYLARQAATGLPVALKVIVPEPGASDKGVQTFLREASVLSRLNHPRIVRFHEVGMARGLFFFAMEYVETVNLAELLAGLAPAARVRTACGILCQALEALHFAHGLGFVHRDVKPGNLLVTRQGRKLRVKLADFGLAKNYQNAGFSGLTSVGDACGTPAFMAPEQLLDCRSALPAADLYGAGATLYALLTGQFPHDYTTRKGPYAIILEEAPVPLRQRCPEAPDGLEAAVLRSLAREPGDRFASAAQMRQALLPFAAGGRGG